MFFENGKAVNQAAKTVVKFLAEKGITLPHNEALNLVARLQGFPSHETATSRLTGLRQGIPQKLESWVDLFQVIACMNATERRGKITLADTAGAPGKVAIYESQQLLKATDVSLKGTEDGALKSAPFVLAYSTNAPTVRSDDEKLAHRIAMQAELVSGEPGIYQEVYAAMLRNSLACLQEVNRRWDVSLMDGPWVIWSQKEKGYWHHNFGWVGDRDSALGYPSDLDAAEAVYYVGIDDAQARYEP
jgi:hypothetical protein